MKNHFGARLGEKDGTKATLQLTPKVFRFFPGVDEPFGKATTKATADAATETTKATTEARETRSKLQRSTR